MTKQSCHDSGIDIRDPSLVGSVSRKTTYSDAELLLSDNSEFLPPKPVRQLSRGEDEASPNPKKSNSVSFSLEDSKESSLDQQSGKSSVTDDAEKQAETKKNKVSNACLNCCRVVLYIVFHFLLNFLCKIITF